MPLRNDNGTIDTSPLRNIQTLTPNGDGTMLAQPAEWALEAAELIDELVATIDRLHERITSYVTEQETVRETQRKLDRERQMHYSDYMRALDKITEALSGTDEALDAIRQGKATRRAREALYHLRRYVQGIKEYAPGPNDDWRWNSATGGFMEGPRGT